MAREQFTLFDDSVGLSEKEQGLTLVTRLGERLTKAQALDATNAKMEAHIADLKSGDGLGILKAVIHGYHKDAAQRKVVVNRAIGAIDSHRCRR